MSLKLLMDEHVAKAITVALLARRVDVVTAQQVQADAIDDNDLIRRATELE